MVILTASFRYWTIFIALSTIFFIYLTLINLSITGNFEKEGNTYEAGVKKIVAYSLLKQIEIESEEYNCDGQLDSNASDYKVISEGVERYKSVEVNYDASQRTADEGSSSWTRIDGSNLYVSSVNLDKRLHPYHYIRIIGAVEGKLETGKLETAIFCQVSTANGGLHFMKVTTNYIWSENWDQDDNNSYFHPLLLSCRVPFGETPLSVSLATVPCERRSEQNFRIIEIKNKPATTFTVCVKPLEFRDDISEHLIQWIEIIRILGADKIEFYVGKVEKKVWKILKWYSHTFPDEIVVKKFSTIVKKMEGKKSTSKSSNYFQKIWQKRRYEIIAYNNCFYKNIHYSKFIVPLDIDEIIVPRGVRTWKLFLEKIFLSSPKLETHYASFTVPNAYFFKQFPLRNNPNPVFFLRNTVRSNFSPAGESGKSFISTKNSLIIFNHYALDTLKPGIRRAYFLPSDLVQLNHYKETCNAVILPECGKYLSRPKIRDNVMFKFENVFIEKYNETLTEMKNIGL